MILNSRPLPPRQRRRELSQELERIILKCLEKKPDKRYESAAKLMAALWPLVRPGAGLAWRRFSVPVISALLLMGAALFAVDVGGLRHRLFAAPTRSLAVLPLENLSRDLDQEFFAEGLTEELISILGNVGALRVISRESAMSYRNTNKRLPQIARELHVDNLVLGSVQRAGDRVRIRVRLVRGSDERQVWSSSYDSGLRDVLALQSQIAQAVARELRTRMTADELVRLRVAQPVIPTAHDAYLKGRFYFNRYDASDFHLALDYFQEAVRQDPTYALAYAGLADGYYGLSNWVMPPNEVMPRSRAAAIKALELDSTLAEAHSALATVRAVYEWNRIAAEKEYRRAIELKPGYASAHEYLGVLLSCNGRFDEAIREMRVGWKLDPLSSSVNLFQLIPLNYSRRDDLAIEAARNRIEVDPKFWGPHLILGQVLLRRHAFPEALVELHEASRLDPSPFIRAWLGYAYAVAGKRDSALIIRQELEERSRRTYVGAYGMAVLSVGLGERDVAFAQLGEAIEERSEDMNYVKVDPALDPLHSDPRFAEILRRAGFPP
jgi:TolB-like protein